MLSFVRRFPDSWRADWAGRVRRAALALVLALGIAAILFVLQGHYPLRDWLSVRLTEYWGLTAYWALGCTAAGFATLSPLRRSLRTTERWALAFPVGLVLFGAAIFMVGLAGGLNKVSFAVLPGALTLLGAPAALRPARRMVRHRRGLRRIILSAYGPIAVLAVTLGVVGLLAVYVPILTQQNVQHDARWYHLPIAQQYASQGAITKWDEGWLLGTYPHLASLQYTWAMLWPTGIVHRIGLASHMEFVAFLLTLTGIPVMMRRVLPRARIPVSWAAIFLFPGFLTYDSNLGTGADHFAAVFAPAIVLLLLAFYRSPRVIIGGVLGVMIAGAAWTKYSAACVVAPGLLGACMAIALRKPSSSGWGVSIARRLAGIGGVFAGFVVGFSPHWLKNLLWYGDPLYPMLYHHLALRPWNPDAARFYERFVEVSVLRPTKDLDGVVETLKAVLGLGFQVNEFGFHGEFPTFGFLFAVALVALPFAKAPRRVWWLFGLSLVGATVWYWTNHRDRYLQTALPWLVVGTLAVIYLAWQQGVVHRVVIGALVVTQIVAGADIYFLPDHLMAAGKHPLPSVIKLVDQGHHGKFEERYQPAPEWCFADWTTLGRSVPRGSRVLVHEESLWVGLDAPVVVDEALWQAGLQYGTMKDPAAVLDALRGMRVSYVVTGNGHKEDGDHGLAGELLFWDLLVHSAVKVTKSGVLNLWKLEDTPPALPENTDVAVVTCKLAPPAGLYHFDDLRSPHVRPQPYSKLEGKAFPATELGRQDYAVTEKGCMGTDAASMGGARFELLGAKDNLLFWRKGKPEATP